MKIIKNDKYGKVGQLSNGSYFFYSRFNGRFMPCKKKSSAITQYELTKIITDKDKKKDKKRFKWHI